MLQAETRRLSEREAAYESEMPAAQLGGPTGDIWEVLGYWGDSLKGAAIMGMIWLFCITWGSAKGSFKGTFKGGGVDLRQVRIDPYKNYEAASVIRGVLFGVSLF